MITKRVYTKPKWRAELARCRAEKEKRAARIAHETQRIAELDERIVELERLGILDIVGNIHITPEQLEAFLERQTMAASETSVPSDGADLPDEDGGAAYDGMNDNDEETEENDPNEDAYE